MEKLGRYFGTVPEKEFKRGFQNTPDCTVSELLTYTFSLRDIPVRYTSEALHELLVDIFLLYACKCLSNKDRVFILIPQMKVYEKSGERGRDYMADSAICQTSEG